MRTACLSRSSRTALLGRACIFTILASSSIFPRESRAAMAQAVEAGRAVAVLSSGALLHSHPAAAQVAEAAIAAKRSHGLTVVLASPSGKVNAGVNSLCVLFQSAREKRSGEVQNVTVQFTLVTGRNRGNPLVLQPDRQTRGRYCGTIDLGVQQYFPARYEVGVHYQDASGKKRTLWFYLSLN